MNSPTTSAIDTHAHVYPAWYLDQLERGGAPAASTAIARDIGADSTPADMEERIRDMDAAGVEKQVLAVTPQSPSLPGAAESADAARAINDDYLRLVEKYPGRFLAYAALPLPHVDETLAELERIADAGFVGVSLSALLPGGGSLVADSLAPVWDALNSAAAVVNIHPTGQGACSTPITSHHLEWVNGAPVEDAIATLQLLKADVPGRWPDVTIHVAHLGGDLPFLMQRLEDNYEDWDAFARSPRESLRGMYFDAANFFEPSLCLAVEAFGPTQILGGSDMPYFRGEKYVRAFEYVRGARLGGAEKRAILRDNALKLYGLDEDA
ncbi:amidohydrolase family protein [Corynebacterium sp. LK2510]|uniref:amidohydrolase family protein n=1 Tax=Corynebacterium sp. LK2510 TaxID=3110472 RepID=UPI0034CD5AA5